MQLKTSRRFADGKQEKDRHDRERPTEAYCIGLLQFRNTRISKMVLNSTNNVSL